MNTKFNIPSFWQRWCKQRPHLPAHLPRLVLADQFQPSFVRRCPVTQRLLPLLRLLDWEQLPTTCSWQRSGERTVPLAAYIGAYLVQLAEQLPTCGALRRYLREHPALVWSLGFPLVSSGDPALPFDMEAALPSQRHFNRKLALLPNGLLQLLLDSQVAWLQHQLGTLFGQTVVLDTKHILAWVKENNPKAYIKEGRFDKTVQPAGDPDCKVGCKRRKNQVTPTQEGKPASHKVSVGEYYWGYASGVIATKVADVGELVLAECTQTFDHADLSYFFPLMAQVEQRLGFRPPYFAADAAFDAFYVYDYFHQPDSPGFAAIPLRNLRQQPRQFDADGLPLCAAGLAMPLFGRFTNRTSLVQHQRGRYGCPLLHPHPTGTTCPIDHPKWPQGGCKTVMSTAAGARVRYTLDRESERYQQVFKQRTAVERLFSQAVQLGIERPKLRNREAITNRNSLTYLLINLRAMHRIEQKLTDSDD